MKFNEEVFEGTIDIVAAAMEEAEVELSAEGGEKVAEFFEAIYKRLAVIAEEEEEDDEEEDDEEDSDEDEESEDGEEDFEEEPDEDEESEEDEEDSEERSEGAVEEESAEEIVVVEEKPAARTGSFEVYVDAKGKYRFRMKAANGQTIAVSQAYNKKESCLKGVESVRKHAGGAVVK